MSSISIVQSDNDATIVQIDPVFCQFTVHAPLGEEIAVPDGALSVNVNYVQLAEAHIAIMISQGHHVQPELPLPPDKPRTALIIRSNGAAEFTGPINAPEDEPIILDALESGWTVVQAGPRLLANGKAVSGENENFDDSVIRQTQQVGIGITSAGKVLIGFVANETAASLGARLLKAGATDAMKCDGGPGFAHLGFAGNIRGTARPQTMLIVSQKT